MSSVRGIALVGLMGSGKSTVADVIGERLGLPVYDTDQMVEAVTGTSIAQFFAARGEAAFRQQEVACLETALDEMPCVVATGGGIVVTSSGRSALERAPFAVYLEVSPREAAARVGDDPDRPLLAGDAFEVLDRLLLERDAWYREVSDLTVRVDGRSPEEVAEVIVGACEAHG